MGQIHKLERSSDMLRPTFCTSGDMDYSNHHHNIMRRPRSESSTHRLPMLRMVRYGVRRHHTLRVMVELALIITFPSVAAIDHRDA